MQPSGQHGRPGRRLLARSGVPSATRDLLGRFLGVPRELLERVRWLFFLFLLFGVGSAFPDLASTDVALWPDQTIASAAALSIVVWALATYRTGGRWWPLDVVPAAALATVGTVLGDPGWVAGQAPVMLFFRSLYGGRGRVHSNAALYYLVHQVVVTLATGQQPFRSASLPVLVGFVFTAGLVHELARVLVGYERLTARETALTEAGALLLAARDETELREVAAVSALALVGRPAGVAAIVHEVVDATLLPVVCEGAPGGRRSPLPLAWLPAETEQALNSASVVQQDSPALAEQLGAPPGYRHTVVVPVVRDGDLRATLTVASADPPSDGVSEALGRLGVDLVLALDRVALTSHLATSEALFRGVVEGSSDVIAILDTSGEIRLVSPAVSDGFGFRPEQVVGRHATEGVHPDDRGRLLAALAAAGDGGDSRDPFECRLRRADGAWRQAEITASRVRDGSDHVVLVIRDVTDRKQLEAEITFRAYHDPVTTLANRTLFHDRLAMACERARRSGSSVAVALLDLDDFKAVNDNLGHASGDALLAEVAQRLSGAIRASDTAARLGGDEFAILLEGIDDAVQAVDVVERALRSLRRPIHVGARALSVHASIGLVVTTPSEPDPPDELLRNADVAMYAAKAAGKGRYEIFDPSMHVAALERLELRAELESAVDRGELTLFYQPVVALDGAEVIGVEALLRWRHPTRGMLAPDAFMTLAEESRLVVPIGRWVLEEACRQAARWAAIDRPLTVNVNLSAVQLHQPALVDEVADALRAARMEPWQLTLEVTETALMGDADAAAAALAELKGLGVRLAIDDFGTGYSSFGYLRRFPVDVLKIDRTFVANIDTGHDEATLARAIVMLAQTLGLDTVGEGVERAEQAQVLRAWGCHSAQGYHYAPPLPAEVFPAWLSAYRAGLSRGDSSMVASVRATG